MTPGTESVSPAPTVKRVWLGKGSHPGTTSRIVLTALENYSPNVVLPVSSLSRESEELASSPSKGGTGTTIVSSVALARAAWWARDSSLTVRT